MLYTKLFLVSVLLWVPALAAFASPFVVSDPTTTAGITHCAWYLDSTPRQLVPAPKDSSNRPYCSLDIEGISVGSHSVTAAFVRTDEIWGTEEGPKSSPLVFQRPAGVTVSPSRLTIKP